MGVELELTTSIVTSSQKDTTSSLSLSDNMTSSRRTQDTILTDQKLLDTICSSNLSDQLYDLWIPVSSITTNDEETILDTFGDGEEDAGDEGFTVVRLLKDDDLLS